MADFKAGDKNIKVTMPMPRRCGECLFYQEKPYFCHNERGTQCHCSMGFMKEDMRDKSFENRLYPGCKLEEKEE